MFTVVMKRHATNGKHTSTYCYAVLTNPENWVEHRAKLRIALEADGFQVIERSQHIRATKGLDTITYWLELAERW